MNATDEREYWRAMRLLKEDRGYTTMADNIAEAMNIAAGYGFTVFLSTLGRPLVERLATPAELLAAWEKLDEPPVNMERERVEYFVPKPVYATFNIRNVMKHHKTSTYYPAAEAQREHLELVNIDATELPYHVRVCLTLDDYRRLLRMAGLADIGTVSDG